MYEQEKEKKILIGSTETIQGDFSPYFEKVIDLNFFFERKQPLLFELCNVEEFGEISIIASAQLDLGQIMAAPKQEISVDLTSDDAIFGRLTIEGKVNKSANQHVSFEMCWRNLNNSSSRYLGLCQTITPVFLRISRSSFEKDFDDQLVYQSPIFTSTRNPLHRHMRLSL